MRRALLILFIVTSATLGYGQKVHSLEPIPKGNKFALLTDQKPLEVDYPGHEIVEQFIKKRLKNPKKNKKSNTTFNVVYEPSVRFPQEMIDAFELGALPIIAELFDSDVPINISMDRITQEGALAGARPATPFYYRGIRNSPCLDCWVPVALAEKLSGETLNPEGEADIEIFVNFDNPFWYFDYENPEGVGTNFDFVTVMLHEMFHALGYTGFAGLRDDQTGTMLLDNTTSLFDYYMENGNGQIIRETFDENSLRLGTAFSNNDLYWNGFKIGQIDERARLYAPRNFAQGSSIHHVNEGTYQSGPDALMTPTAQRGQVLQDGGIAVEMLYDMGWAMAQINVLVEEEATEELDQDLDLRAQIISDIEYDQTSVAIHISTDTFGTETVVPMDATNEVDIFNTIIDATGGPQNVQYYIEVTDSRGVTRTSPSPAPRFFFEYQFILDNEGPEILHDPIVSLNEVDKISTLELTADITDPLNVGSVFIEWTINGSDAIELTEMVFNENSDDPFAENEYIGTIDFGRALTAADVLEYRISATDEAKGSNTSTFPSDGSFISVPITPETPPVNFYANDFNSDTEDFEGNGFSIRTERNFADPAIHSNHPYLNAGEGNSFNLTYELKIPILIEEQRPVIEFEEVVLVEPGDPGTVFGQDEFWDYVIVEGKKRGTQDWLPFLDGYDAQSNATWETAYNSTISGQNSLGSGRSSQYRTRKINMVENGNFAFGDTVAVRFRLFSDPFAYGWGWAIDNLAIQDLNSAVEDFVEEQNFDIIPNPASDQVLVSLNLENAADDMRITVVDITGRIVQDRALTNKSLRVRERLPLDDLESGVYLVNIIFNGKDVITKKLIKQ